jgi:hypothetical protein
VPEAVRVTTAPNMEVERAWRTSAAGVVASAALSYTACASSSPGADGGCVAAAALTAPTATADAGAAEPKPACSSAITATTRS